MIYNNSMVINLKYFAIRKRHVRQRIQKNTNVALFSMDQLCLLHHNLMNAKPNDSYMTGYISEGEEFCISIHTILISYVTNISDAL